jgi:hypothetical protein
VWLSRELEFAVGDPGAERWGRGRLHHRLLVDGPQFWLRPEPPPPAGTVPVHPRRREAMWSLAQQCSSYAASRARV